MGVHGLWKLIESSGKPVPLETLENKVLAVDVSIWLHQAIKGFQDHKGAPVQNAHLLGIYHRVCKLLYFKIKPIFVFDGGVPVLKRQTIAKRNQYKSRNISEADRLQRQLINTLLKHTAISKVLSEKTKASLPLPKKSSGKYDNLYALPSTEFDSTLSSSEEDDVEESSESATTDSSPTKQWDLHTIDTASHYFKTLPLEVKHEILTDLKETRKQNSWGKLHQLPKQSDDFSSYQMKRLLKRQEVQSALDEVSKEMGGMSLSLAELETLLKDQGIKTTNDSNIGKRIASDDKTRYLYIRDIQKEIEKVEETAKKKQSIEHNVQDEEEELKKAIQLSLEETPSTSTTEISEVKKKTKADLEEEEELQQAIQLSLGETEPSSTNPKEKFSFLESFNDGDFQSESDEDCDIKETTTKPAKVIDKKLSSAQSYMLEYSGLTPAEIDKIIRGNQIPVNNKQNFKNPKLNKLNMTSIKELQSGEIQTGIKLATITEEIKIDQPSQKTNETKKDTDNHETNLKDDNNIEIMSDSEDSDVCSLESPKPSMEIVIDPNKTEDNLFKDIFNKEVSSSNNKLTNDSLNKDADSQTNKPLEIVIDPNKTNDDDLFKDIFDKDESVLTSERSFESSEQDGVIKLNKDSQTNKPIENVIDPNKTDDDNLFKDIFDKDDSFKNNLEQNDSLKLNKESRTNKPIEIVIDPNKTNDDDLFKDIFDKDDSFNMNSSSESEPIVKKQDKSLDSIEIKSSEGKLENETIEVRGISETSVIPKLTIEEMRELKDSLQSEKIDLIREKSNKERLANNITDQMYQEAQELLELFGVPYVVAPMEAEAQCAFLDIIELTNGTITDDSDIWLFGGRTVYKNFFNQSKYVMEFKSENIEHHFKLSRQQLILLALLVGSDYTSGLQGVGPVTALEILASFPPLESHEFTLSNNQLVSGLREFKSWYVKGKTAGPGRSGLKNKLKNVTFTEHFPNPQVVEAYLDPKVETSKDPFSWSKPDITGLTVFAKEKFGWTMQKTEDILNPVIKKLEEHQTQKSIKEYFKTQFKVDSLNIESKVSKRVKDAIGKIGKTQDELIAEEMVQLEKTKQKAIGKKYADKSKDVKSRSKKVNKANQKTKDPEEIMENKSTKLDENSEELKKSVKRKKSKDPEVIEENNSTAEKLEIPVRRKQTKSRKKTEEQVEMEPGPSNLLKTSRKKKVDKPDTETLISNPLEDMEELKDFENLASELKSRRKRKNELMKLKVENSFKKKPKTVVTNLPLENVPKELEDDDEIKYLLATSSKSDQRVEQIQVDVLKQLEEKPKPKKMVPIKNLHTKDVIHQRIRDKSNSLRNKIKAIEVFRKSKMGPGYVPKRQKTFLAPKADAELSEDSD